LHLAAALLFGGSFLAAVQGAGGASPQAAPAPAPAPQDAPKPDNSKPQPPRQEEPSRVVQKGDVDQAIVEEVVFRGSKRMTEEALRLRVRTQKGKPYSAKVADEDIKAIAQFLVWTSKVEATRLPSGGVRVVFELGDVPTVRRVRFIGNKKLEESDLRKALGLSETGTIPAPTISDRGGGGLLVLVRKLEEKYQEEGYLHVEIAPRLEKDGDDFVLAFHVIEGPEVHVDHIEFEGLRDFTSSPWRFWERHPIRSLMKTSRSFWIFTQTYKPEVLQEDVVQIEQFLWDEGYLDARVAVESVTSNELGDTVDLVIRIDQGPRYSIKSVQFTGNAKFPTSELLGAGLVKMQPGMPYRQTLYRKDRDRIIKYYRHRGYVEVSLPPKPVESCALGSTEIDLTFKINEDLPKNVGDVRVVGNKNTKDEVVRRELDLHPGELFDGDEMDLATDRLRATGFFSDDQNRPNAWVEQEKIADDPRHENIVLRVNDGTNGVFNIFGGIASGQGPFFGVDLAISNADIFDLPSSPGSTFQEFIEQRAFHGAGQRIHLRANPGSQYSNYLVEFSEPYLDGPAVDPYYLNANVHLVEYTPRFYNEQTLGTLMTVGKKLSRNTSVSLGLRIDNVDISNIVVLTPPIEDLEAAQGVTQVHGLLADYSWQQLDSLRNPTDGERVDLGGQLMGGPLGAEVDGYKLSGSVEWMLPVWENEDEQRQVFSLRGATGFAHAFGSNDDLPFFERFFAGGPNDFLQMRGFAWRGMGPHDQGFSEGGDIGWVVNAEYVFPLLDTYDARLRENQPFLRGLFFVDQGMLSQDWNSLLVDRYRVSAGVGLRLRIPIQILSAPLELYYGVPLQRTREDERESFQISFSAKF
jgi:outer membrane protein insertion porin family